MVMLRQNKTNIAIVKNYAIDKGYYMSSKSIVVKIYTILSYRHICRSTNVHIIIKVTSFSKNLFPYLVPNPLIPSVEKGLLEEGL